MSRNNKQKVQIIIDALCDYLEADGIPELAEKLDVTPNAIYRWRDRQSVPGKKINKMFPELNLNFLETGEGPLLKESAQNANESIQAKIKRYVDRAESEGISDTERVLLLEYLQGRAESLSKELAEFGRIVERLKLMMKDDDPDSSDS